MNQVMSVNLDGTLFAAQAAGRQMVRFGTNGSIIMIASMCGSIALEVGCRSWLGQREHLELTFC